MSHTVTRLFSSFPKHVHVYEFLEKKNPLTCLKSSKHIKENGDGPYRSFSY